MNISDDNFWLWVDRHIADDPVRLRLKYSHTAGDIDYNAAITQIECRQRFGKKLAATLAAIPRFYFPSKLAGEQSTSDRLAQFHASLVIAGNPIIDLTAGLGIDILHCSDVCSSAIAVERNPDTAYALRHNAALKPASVDVVCDDCRHFVAGCGPSTSATVFIDPARRAADGSRVFALSACEPDVTAMLPDIATICRRLVVKMSPMLDISHTIAALGGCSRIIALGNTTDCKELIAVKDFDAACSDTVIEAVTLSASGSSSFAYSAARADDGQCRLAMPCEGDYLYEPYPSLMKIGAPQLLAARFDLSSFHPNTRLFHSPDLHKDFPGDIFQIERIVDYASKNIKRLKNDYPAISISARNFGLSAEQLRRQLGVRDGGDRRLFAITSSANRRTMLITHHA